MNIKFLQEPELEFGTGRHVDIRFGLMNHGPLDFSNPLAPKLIKVGMVGTPETIEGLSRWFDTTRFGVDAKPSKQPNLFPRFPGSSQEESFRCSLLLDSQLKRSINQSVLDRIAARTSGDDLVREAVQIFLNEFRYIVENANPDVLVCALPLSLYEAMESGGNAAQKRPKSSSISTREKGEFVSKLNFHHLLKSEAMILKKPVQIILPMTYDKLSRRRQKSRPERVKQIQDEATIAWNLHTALYYKAGGVPWRLIRDSTQLTTCYIGVSFYHTLDRSKVMTSIGQVFNQRGEGVIVRGGTVKISKDDRQPHLSQDGARNLLVAALERYREVHRTFPARVVLHKSSSFNSDELNGFVEAIEENRLDHYDLISMGESSVKLFRSGEYPVLRGTLLSLDGSTHALYTRGGVDFFETYPGMYAPVPLLFRCEYTTETPASIAHEMMALTKMNWNNTQFDGREPITIRAARQVGSILKYIPEGEDYRIEPRYSFYM